MSQQRPQINLDELPAPVCDSCGEEIEHADQDCPALDDGRCRP